MNKLENSHCFIHTDASNLFYRQARMTNPKLGIDSMVGMSLHMILNSMKKEFMRWEGTHVVVHLEGKSWRKSIYKDYKANRAVSFALQTEEEQENHKVLLEAFDNLIDYFINKTNITVLRNPGAEADDMIAVFIESHSNDKHIVISSDSDFLQLLKFPNVTLYDPVKDILIKQDGVYDEKNNKLSFVVTPDAKIKIGDPDPNFEVDDDWYDYALFKKCIRGDKTDNIFSAYPGVREKGTKTAIGIKEAYDDRLNKGYKWNNFMMQKFIHHDGTEHTVKDDYLVNRKLIDLSEIPENIKTQCLQIISAETEKKDVPALEIGLGFMKFAGKWDLKRIADSATQFIPMLKSQYKKNK